MKRFNQLEATLTEAQEESRIKQVLPLFKLLVTLIFVLIVASHKMTGTQLIYLTLYPGWLLIMSDVKLKSFMIKVFIALGVVFGFALFYPLLYRETLYHIGRINITNGMIQMVFMLWKGILLIASGLLLVETTGFEKLVLSLKQLKVPSFFIVLLLMTYRYLIVFTREFKTTLDSYQLRQGERRFKLMELGTIFGQIIIRTYHRAEMIHQSMVLRGFRKEFHLEKQATVDLRSVIYAGLWIIYFIIIQ